VDCSEISFIDSGGLGSIVASLKVARQLEGDVRIACVTDQMRVVLRLTALGAVLKPYASVEEAVADF
jgi:anti-sigma B factor antagonist